MPRETWLGESRSPPFGMSTQVVTKGLVKAASPTGMRSDILRDMYIAQRSRRAPDMVYSTERRRRTSEQQCNIYIYIYIYVCMHKYIYICTYLYNMHI